LVQNHCAICEQERIAESKVYVGLVGQGDPMLSVGDLSNGEEQA